MTQEEFAGELGVSTPSVRNYEGGTRLSAGAAEKLKTLAVKHRLTDLLINEAGVTLPGVSKVLDGRSSAVRTKRHPEANDLSDHIHEAIDAAISRGDAELIATIESLLSSSVRKAGVPVPKFRQLINDPLTHRIPAGIVSLIGAGDENTWVWHWVESLIHILLSNDKELVAAISSNLAVFSRIAAGAANERESSSVSCFSPASVKGTADSFDNSESELIAKADEALEQSRRARSGDRGDQRDHRGKTGTSGPGSGN